MSPVEPSYFNVVQKTEKMKEYMSCVMSMSREILGELSIVLGCNRPK